MMMVPNGYRAWRDVVDAAGQSTFGKAWTGQLEFQARKGLQSLEDLQRDRNTPGTESSGSGAGPGARLATKPLSELERAARDRDEDQRVAAQQEERAARLRFEAAIIELLTRLEAGVILAFRMSDQTGQIYRIDRPIWRTSIARLRLEKGLSPTGEHQPLLFRLAIKSPKAAPPSPQKESSPPTIVVDNIVPMRKKPTKRRPGPAPTKLEAVLRMMRSRFKTVEDIEGYTDIALVAEFNNPDDPEGSPKRNTCWRARNLLLAELAANSDN